MEQPQTLRLGEAHPLVAEWFQDRCAEGPGSVSELKLLHSFGQWMQTTYPQKTPWSLTHWRKEMKTAGFPRFQARNMGGSHEAA